VDTGACLRTIEQAGHGLCAVFAPGGRHAVVGTKEGALDVLDVGAAAVVETQPAHASAVRGAPPPAGGGSAMLCERRAARARARSPVIGSRAWYDWRREGNKCMVRALSGTTLWPAWPFSWKELDSACCR